jgi:class 3 adenylate cyclase/predicted ATPase
MCGSALAAAIRERRKNVSVLFIDIVGSTALAERLDPEALRQVIDRYFAGCTEAVIAHGGMVEKFIGDAVLAAFGADVSHEDDALRAVRAAADSLAAIEAMNDEIIASHRERLAARCGICSGEVVVTTLESGGFRVIGDPVNTASRLQNAAGTGEILIDAATAGLTRAHAVLAPVPPLTLKGKSRPVPAWRVTSVDPAAAAGDPHAVGPLIGRDDELDQLRQTYRRVTQRRQVCIVTVLGVPGIGKSRLLHEFVRGIGDDTLVLTGRCSAYGKGITYKPLADVVASYPGGWDRLSEFLREADPGGPEIAACLATVLGGSQDQDHDQGQAGVEEISWAARSMLEIAAGSGPVVVVWEDLQWAEENLLNLVDEVASWLTGVPVLQVCLARPELLETRPTWGGGKSCAVTLDLAPLTVAQSTALVCELASSADVTAHQQDDFAASVAVACDGNPLFAELMFDVYAGSAPAGTVPATIAAMLGARLDQLPEDERHVLERAAVIGREFGWEPLLAMSRADDVPDPDARRCLTWLQRRRLIQRAGPAGAFMFTQALLRDTAYGFTPKATRERWHQILACWLSQRSAAAENGSADRYALQMAAHVEAASQLGRELRPGDTRLPQQATAAAGVLITAGEEALARRDLPAAADLLERGLSMLPAGDARQLRTVLHLADACLGHSDADRALTALTALSAAKQAPRLRMVCEIQILTVHVRMRRCRLDQAETTAAGLRETLSASDRDDLAWCRLFQLDAYLHLAADRAGDATEAFRRALRQASRAGDGYEEERVLCAICELAQWSTTTVADGLSLCDELASRFAASRSLLLPVLLTQAHLHALAGDLGVARRSLGIVTRQAQDLHMDLVQAATSEVGGIVETLAGEPAAALRCYRDAERLLRAQNEFHEARTMAIRAARAQLELGQLSQARQELDAVVAADLAGLDLRARVLVQGLRGRVAAAAGAVGAAAIAAAREAVSLSESTQDLCLQGDAWTDLAVVLREADEPDSAAAAAARTALARYESKGAVLLAARVRGWLG